MTSISDITLVTQVTVFHNKQAFNRLVVKYQSPIRRFFIGQTGGDEQLSDDLAQDTFIKAYTNISSFRGLSNFSTWLFRIAYNVFYDYTRSHKMTEDIDTKSVSGLQNKSTSISEKIDINEAMKILNDNERTCITLQLIDGLPIEKITEITGITSGTVKSHLSRGKQKLAQYLKQNGYDRR